MKHCLTLGERPEHSTIYGNSLVRITASLHQALKDIRALKTKNGQDDNFALFRDNGVKRISGIETKNDPYYVWADALCINQENQVERSQQVAIMNKVFRSAHIVNTYIGPMKDDTLSGLKLAIKLEL